MGNEQDEAEVLAENPLMEGMYDLAKFLADKGKKLPALEYEELIDDLIVSILSYWKECGVKEPFAMLHKETAAGRFEFWGSSLKKDFKTRVDSSNVLLKAYREGNKSVRPLLEERGFTGTRVPVKWREKYCG
jgi:hypothetical protein